MSATASDPGPREFAAIRRFIYQMAEVDRTEDVDLVEATDRAVDRLAQLEHHVETIESMARAEAARPNTKEANNAGN